MITPKDLKNIATRRGEEEKWAERQSELLFNKYQKKFGGSKKDLRYLLHKSFYTGD